MTTREENIALADRLERHMNDAAQYDEGLIFDLEPQYQLAVSEALRATPPEPTEGLHEAAARLVDCADCMIITDVAGNRFRKVFADDLSTLAVALRTMPLQNRGTMAEAIHMLIRLVRMKVPGDEPNEVKFAFAALRGEPVSVWQPISTIPSSDDLVWLASSKTLSIEGPRAPSVFDADSFDLWCECAYPPLPAMVAEDGTK